jgi:sulfate/thiosulfate-binding protein
MINSGAQNRQNFWRKALRRIAVVFIGVVASSLLGGASSVSASAGTVDVVGYSTPAAVYGDQNTKGTLEYAFARTNAGQGVTFNNSFAASDSQTAAVANGQPADIVNLSYAPNMTTLVKAGKVSKKWNQNKYRGFVTDSVVAFAIRSGNPKKISSWKSLIKSGVQVVTPSTATSGGAKWNIMAAYGSEFFQTNSKSKAVKYLKKLKTNIVAEPSSASQSMAAFLGGVGDVLIGYEDDIMNAIKANPGALQMVVPSRSLLIENPMATTIPPAAQNQAEGKKFAKFLWSLKAQNIWAKNDYWPVNKKVAKKYTFPKPKKMFNIRALGGWNKVDKSFFGPNGTWTKIDG